MILNLFFISLFQAYSTVFICWNSYCLFPIIERASWSTKRYYGILFITWNPIYWSQLHLNFCSFKLGNVKLLTFGWIILSNQSKFFQKGNFTFLLISKEEGDFISSLISEMCKYLHALGFCRSGHCSLQNFSLFSGMDHL